ncbi:MAG: hypothetical protein ACREMY_00325 [bacterium]
MYERVLELVKLVGKGVYVVLVGMCLGIYGAIELLAHSKTSGWLWVIGGIATLMIVTLGVAYQALRARDETLESLESKGDGARTFFQGGEHTHFYVPPPPPEDESENAARDRLAGKDEETEPRPPTENQS